LSTNIGAVTNLRWYPAAAGPTAATVVNNVTSPYTLNSLTASTDYVIEVFDSCGILASNVLMDTLSTLICDTVTADFTFNGRFLRRSFTSTSVNADSLFWQFGALDSSFVTNPNYSFPSAGVYTITLIALNDCGNIDTLISTITVCDTLRANFTNSFANDSTRFYADPGNNALGYSWDLDDGFTATGDTVGVKYNDANPKSVTLTSWNDCGDTVRNTRSIPGCLPPVADWVYTILSPINAGLRIQFDASSSTNGSNYSWDFGDGNTGSGINPIHIYSTPGLQYKVKLTVTNNCGGEDIREFRLTQIGLEELEAHASVRIYPNPTNDFIYIDYGSPNLEIKAAKIYNSQGKLVLFQKLDTGDKHTLNTVELSPGLYQIMLETNYGFVNDKILIK
jgi:PKD repeat protein